MARVAALASGLVLTSATWDDYRMKFGKMYNCGDDCELTRAHKATYEANAQLIAEQNSKGESLKFGENYFTDLTQDEYKQLAGLGYIQFSGYMNFPHLGQHVHNGEELSASVDWTTQGVVTPVKDQGSCGSCWAFSTTGSIEGAWQIGSGQLISVSEQQLVDCSSQNQGCSGGNMAVAISYEKGVDVCTESSYPYMGVQFSCKSSCTAAIPKGGVSGYKSVGSLSFGAKVNDLKSALQLNPVSIAIEADQSSFQHYQSGVISSGCGTSLDHGVLAVGYGSENDEDFWLVKNSWGSSWGASGYVKISQSGNTCGVLTQPVYPVVSASVVV